MKTVEGLRGREFRQRVLTEDFHYAPHAAVAFTRDNTPENCGTIASKGQ